MPQKAPAFQFYVKDWRSSPTVLGMTREERGTYIDLLALAWENAALIPSDLQMLAKCLFGYNCRSLANFLAKFPETFVKLPAKFGESLVNLKLREQWEELEQYKQDQSEAGKRGNEKRWAKPSQPDSGGNRSASASSSASSTKNKTKNHKPTPPESSLLAQCRQFSYDDFEKRTGQKPSWDTGHYTQLARLFQRKPDITAEDYQTRWRRFMESTEQYVIGQGMSLCWFALNYDRFLNGQGKGIHDTEKHAEIRRLLGISESV